MQPTEGKLNHTSEGRGHKEDKDGPEGSDTSKKLHIKGTLRDSHNIESTWG